MEEASWQSHRPLHIKCSAITNNPVLMTEWYLNSGITAYYLLITASKEGKEKDETSILHEESSTPRWTARIEALEL